MSKKSALGVAVASVLSGMAIGIAVAPVPANTPTPTVTQQPFCPTEDSCHAKPDYHDGQWHLVVTPDVP